MQPKKKKKIADERAGVGFSHIIYDLINHDSLKNAEQ